MPLYDFLVQISNLLGQPFRNLAYVTENIPFLAAFFLGIVGAMAPCQFTGNLGALTIYTNESLKRRNSWKDVGFYLAGKILAFSLLGVLVWMFGQEFQRSLTLYFPYVRKLIGPMYILIGLYLFGVMKMYWNITIVRIPDRWKDQPFMGSFFLGISTSLAFCPTMFVLFFISLMPIVLSSSYGFVLPIVFAIGTSIPVLIGVFLLFYLGLAGKVYEKGRKVGLLVQRLAGIVVFVIGLLDTITYWL